MANRSVFKPQYLPWVLVAILAVTSIVLATLYGQALAKLEHASSKPTGTATVAAAPAEVTDSGLAADNTMTDLATRKSSDIAAMGPVDAPVVMVEVSDFTCPFCAHFAHQTHKQLLPYVESGSLRIERIGATYFDTADLGAKAVFAAGLQGKYWEFYEALYAASPENGHLQITQDLVMEKAKAAGVADLEKFAADLKSEQVAKLVEADQKRIFDAGIGSVPTFVINGQVIPGAQDTSVFVKTIESLGGHK